MNMIARAALALLFATGITAGVASNAQPAQAAVVVGGGIGISFGTGVAFGGGYAPRYHWARWHDGYGWHRRWVPIGWVAPVAYGPAPVYYGPRYAAVRYGGDWHRDRDWHRDHDWHGGDHDWQHDHR